MNCDKKKCNLVSSFCRQCRKEKGSKKKQSSLDMAYINHIRKLLTKYKRLGKTGENQTLALNAIGHKKTKSLTDIEQEQVLSIYKDYKRGIRN